MIGADKLEIPAQSQPLLGKTAADLISADTKVMANGDVRGTLPYVEKYTGYSNDAETQEGNYFPIKITKSGENLETDVDGKQKKQAFPDDSLLVIRVPQNDTKAKISVDGQELVTLNFATATLGTKEGS